MGAVLVVVAIGAVALVGAVIGGVTWRRGMDERQSVKQYQRSLDTLRHVSDRVEGSRPRPSERTERTERTGRSPGARGAAPPRRSSGGDAPPAGARATGRATPTPAPTPESDVRTKADVPAKVEGRPALVFDDAAPPAPAPTATDPAAKQAIPRMGGGGRVARGPRSSTRPLLTVAGVAVFIAAVVVAAVALRPGPVTHSTSASRHHATTSPPPPTASSPLQPAASTASTATYAWASSPFTVVLTATGQCWVMAVDATSGKVVWTGTMTAGQSQPLPSSSTLKVTMGAASDVTLTVQGRPIALPSGYQSPFVATFTAGGATPAPAA